MPTAPIYVSTTDKSYYDPGAGLPEITPKGTLISDQPTLDAVVTSAALHGVQLGFNTVSGGGAAQTPIRYVPVLTGTPGQAYGIAGDGTTSLITPAGGGVTVTDNGDGTVTLTGGGVTVTDNGDGTATAA